MLMISDILFQPKDLNSTKIKSYSLGAKEK